MAEDVYPKRYLYRRIVRAKRYIDRHYAENIDLEHIADEACYSKYHFLRLFRQIYGQTPHRYLTAVRIDRARQLLKEDRPVAEVCRAVGFESVGSFTELFRRHVDEPPSAFREKTRQKREDVRRAPLTVVSTALPPRAAGDGL